MAALEHDSFFGDRVIQAVMNCIQHSENLKIISSAELDIVNKAHAIRHLHHDMPNGLLHVLQQCQEYIFPHDAVMFLLEAHEANILQSVVDMFTTAAREGIQLSVEDMYQTMETANYQGLPYSWVVTVIGEEKQQKQSSQPKNAFSLHTDDLSL